MASQKNKKEKTSSRSEKSSGEKWHKTLADETKQSIFAVASFVLAVFFSLSYFDKAGVVGNYVYKILFLLFGAGYFLLPVVFFLAAIFLIFSIKPYFLQHTFIGGGLFLLSGLGLTDVLLGQKAGGYVGYFISWPLLTLFEFWVSVVALTALFIISFLIMLNTAISLGFFGKKTDEELNAEKSAKEKIAKDKKEDKEKEAKKKEDEEKNKKEKGGILNAIKEIMPSSKSESKDKKDDKDSKEKLIIESKKIKRIDFTPPPIELLSDDKGKPSSGDIKANANIIKRTLQNFGIEVEMGEINIGPSVTQYTLKPAEGIKLSRIVGLQNDLSLALAAHPLRIEAPIPGRPLVGIEAPNSAKTLVGMARLFADDNFKNTSTPLLLAMGRDVTGKPIYANLAKMPHMLIAGATGAGKSVCIHTIITSLLYRNSPESLRFIMVDPKRVELTIYNKIPHLLTPVITQPKKAILALKWACKEMDRRYEELLKAGVRDILSYHEKMGGYGGMPYIVVMIDELADMMSMYPREMEASIVRLAQMSRAVGIHLIVSTQRPSVEVITGLIKANIPSRVALQVASQVDSRTILDMSGAEKLLGSGDMLFLAGNVTSKPRRLQGPFISDQELKRVTDYIEEEYKDLDIDTEEISTDEDSGGDKAKTQTAFDMTRMGMPVMPEINLDDKDLERFDLSEEDKNGNGEDDFYEQAREMVIQTSKASTSYLQRKFKIGYARAARLMDLLEQKGVVSPGDGAKPREVLIKDSGEKTLEEQADALLGETNEEALNNEL